MNHLHRKNILVVGDFMLDVYTFGEVVRISPEAPVPVLRVTKETRHPGGAGNAILNLISLGMDVVGVGRVGDDEGGRTFLQAMRNEGVDTRGILPDLSFQTPLKNRMIAAGQQIVRIDYEQSAPLHTTLEKAVIAHLPTLLDNVHVIAISDYAKGFLTPSLLREIIQRANTQSIPVIVDPKGRDFTRYRGATLIKPNQAEAIGAAGLGMEATLEDVANSLFRTCDVETLMITRSHEGISVFQKQGGREDYPAQKHEVNDPTGAGDTVLAVIAAAMANHYTIGEAAKLANIAAGLAIERIGCARISLTDLIPLHIPLQTSEPSLHTGL